MTDNPQFVILHRVNLNQTEVHKLYGQAKTKDKKFLSPVRLSVMVDVEDGKQEYYGPNPGGVTRDDTGNLRFGVYLAELEEKHTEINRGDFVEYNMSGEKRRFYEVDSANNVTDETKKTIGGFKSYWKLVTGVPVKEDVIPFLNETKGEFQ
jgi:hypothetical protein